MHDHVGRYDIYRAMMKGQKMGIMTEHGLLDCAQHFWNVQYLWVKTWRK